MSIDRNMLKNMINDIINKHFIWEDRELLLYLTEKVIDNDSVRNCIIKWNKTDWIGLPKSKSLFYTEKWKWLPIWNLTSQVFANLYLHSLDEFVKKRLKIKYYWRYVDDFIIIHEDKEFLKSAIDKIRDFLKDELHLNLHPKKIYLQHHKMWVIFLGAFLKPWRIYAGHRIKDSFYKLIFNINRLIKNSRWKLDEEHRKNIIASMNSYLWLLIHLDTFQLKKKFLFLLNPYFWNQFYISSWYRKIVRKKL